MNVHTARQLGAAVKGRRLELDWSQAALASRARVSRQWVVAFEAGKPTAEIGAALRTIAALGLVTDLVVAPTHQGTIDLDELLDG